MGTLATAGVVSGMGQGLLQGLTQLNAGIIQKGIQDDSQDFQTAKLKEQMAHAERLHEGTIAASASEHAKDRAHTEGLLQTKLGADIVSDTRKIDSAEKIHSLDSTSRELIAREGNNTHKEIAVAHDQTLRDIAAMQNKLGHQQLKATELTALQHDMDSVRDSMDRIDIKLMDPLADPESAIGKSLRAAQTEARKRLTHLEALMEARVADMQAKDGITVPKAAAPAEKKPFNPGQYGTAPAPSRSGGIIQTPMPSSAEQEMMRKSIQ